MPSSLYPVFLKQPGAEQQTNSALQGIEITAQARALIADIHATDIGRCECASQLAILAEIGTTAPKGNRT